MVYSKLYHFIRKVHCYILICGFYQLSVKQCIKKWCIDTGVIEPGSVAQAMEEYHYCRCINLRKECFNALVQFQFQKVKG